MAKAAVTEVCTVAAQSNQRCGSDIMSNVNSEKRYVTYPVLCTYRQRYLKIPVTLQVFFNRIMHAT